MSRRETYNRWRLLEKRRIEIRHRGSDVVKEIRNACLDKRRVNDKVKVKTHFQKIRKCSGSSI